MKEEQKFYQTQAIMEKFNKELLENHNTIKLFNYLRNVKHDQFLGDLSDYVAEQTADLKQRLQQTQEELHACEFERIGNATTIKQLTTQLEKERKDKEGLVELLKNIQGVMMTDILYDKEVSDIDNYLSKIGITL